ncbi:MAG: YicC family protein [Phycisphaerales bacterium]|nr:YicC family protein [Phycisphaerales bacterium]
MLRSMTGFGASSIEVDGARYAVEVRSVNNKYFKAQLRVPEELSALEAEIESALARHLARGSVTATVRADFGIVSEGSVLNGEVLERILHDLDKSTPDSIRDRCTIDLAGLLAVPGVLVHESVEAVVERARPVVLELVDKACHDLIAMREREGGALSEELDRHRVSINERVDVIRERAPLVVEQYQERLRQRMTLLLEDVGGSVNDEDLMREVAVYAERTDIAEEVVRLAGHMHQFEQLVCNTAAEPVGRTLDFLSQEMLREANTIASKSSDAEISRNIVEVKGLIDRIKEQAANVE